MGKSALILAWCAIGAGMAHASATGTAAPMVVAAIGAAALHGIAFYFLRRG